MVAMLRCGLPVVLLCSTTIAMARGDTSQEKLRRDTQEFVEVGLAAAARNDWDTAAENLSEASRISENPIVEHLSAVVETHREDPFEAFRYAKGSTVPKNRFPEFHEQHKQILDWSRPAVLGRDADCKYQPKDLFARCPIEEKGALEALVKKYFKVEYHMFWLSHDRAEAERVEPCPYLLLGNKDPELKPDTERRCMARRMFQFYEFPTPPAILLPAPGYQVPW